MYYLLWEDKKLVTKKNKYVTNYYIHERDADIFSTG
jgi:hypothetical protein